jgi:thiol:disulfide interchange protein DsbC
MKKTFAVTLLSLMVSSAFAAIPKDLEKIANTIKTNNNNMPPIEDIRKTPVKGVYEVVVNKNEVFYSDATGKYFFIGNLVTSKNGKHVSLTEERVSKLAAIPFEKFNLNNALVKKVGDGKRKLITFEDPNCGFCRKLQPELDKLKDVTIYTFILPVLGKPSLEVAEKIWCSKDRLGSWAEYMKNKTTPTISDDELAKCDKKGLVDNVTFATQNGIMGTPSLFFSDGTSLRGYASAEEISKKLK